MAVHRSPVFFASPATSYEGLGGVRPALHNVRTHTTSGSQMRTGRRFRRYVQHLEADELPDTGDP